MVATASHADRNLRLWRPSTGDISLVPLDVAPRRLMGVGSVLVVGHDAGVCALVLGVNDDGP